jgi:hypothetical protein
VPDPTTIERLRGLILSAADIRALQPELTGSFIEDYLNIIDNILFLAGEADTDIDLLADTRQDIESLRVKIQKNTSEVINNLKKTNENDQDIETIRIREQRNSSLIDRESKKITENNQDIETLRASMTRFTKKEAELAYGERDILRYALMGI